MKVNQWRQIEEILDDALELEPEERALLLDRVCADDAELRLEVESLLAQQAPSEKFIEAPAVAFAAGVLGDDAGEQLENRRIGA